MQVIRQSKIDFTDCHSRPNTLLALSRIEIEDRKPVQDIVAICKRQVRSDSWTSSPQFEFLSVQARHSVGWIFCVESESNPDARWSQAMPLRTALIALGNAVGQTVPSIPVIEYGVGIYSAENALTVTNPWALEGGKTYRAKNERGIGFEFSCKPDGHSGRVLIQPEGQSGAENRWFDPEIVLHSAHWKTLEALDPQTNTWVRVFDSSNWESGLAGQHDSQSGNPDNNANKDGICRNEDALWALGLFAHGRAKASDT